MESSISKNVAKRLRQSRRGAGLTQEEVADKLGIARSAYGHMESGRNLISLEHLVKLPSILNCRITDLLPNSVVTDYDRTRASDPRLQDLIEWWEIIDDDARIIIHDNMKFFTKKHRR